MNKGPQQECPVAIAAGHIKSKAFVKTECLEVLKMKTKSFNNRRVAHAFAKDNKGFVEELDSRYIVFYNERRIK